jgi:hypothetical protein
LGIRFYLIFKLDVWFDCIGQESVDLGINCLSFSGELISFTNPPSKVIPFDKALSFHQVSLGIFYFKEQIKRLALFFKI